MINLVLHAIGYLILAFLAVLLLALLVALVVGAMLAHAHRWRCDSVPASPYDEDEAEGVGAADAATMQRMEDATVAEWHEARERRAAADQLLEEIG